MYHIQPSSSSSFKAAILGGRNGNVSESLENNNNYIRWLPSFLNAHTIITQPSNVPHSYKIGPIPRIYNHSKSVAQYPAHAYAFICLHSTYKIIRLK